MIYSMNEWKARKLDEASKYLNSNKAAEDASWGAAFFMAALAAFLIGTLVGMYIMSIPVGG